MIINLFLLLGKTVEQLELTTDTIYEVPTEGVITSKIVGTDNGRIFLASEDGNLFEIDYWVFIVLYEFLFNIKYPYVFLRLKNINMPYFFKYI